MLSNKNVAIIKEYLLHRKKYQIGSKDVTENIIQVLDKALIAKEAVSISVGKSKKLDLRRIADQLQEKLNATIVAIIGSTIILYRFSSSLKTHLISE
ncbi:MAG: YhbY family RNA-binding protein [Erysipelotrichaceae bacterium]|jgi:RNA-binding protein|nr:YhbY family RNA-binding protein [Erysipelotrichaceae bacterium]